MHTTARATRKQATTRKAAKPATPKRAAPLTAAQLTRYAKKHPVPASFWVGENDPSKPAKR